MWHICVTGKCVDFSYFGIFYSETPPSRPVPLSLCTMHIASMQLWPLMHLSLTGQKLLPSTLHCAQMHFVFFLFDISPIHQVQQVLHFGGELSRMLALIIIQLFQVSNWFGNKRIRYKKNIVKAQVVIKATLCLIVIVMYSILEAINF